MMDKPARTRFAPSPTGSPHIGNMRTALYDWMLAKNTGGAFVLRIEDTDRERLRPEAVSEMTAALKWLGLDWDEGPDIGGPYEPYVQSMRKPLYAEAVANMLERGSAYLCDCTPERLSQLRERQKAANQAPGYDGRCRNRDRSELEKVKQQGMPVVARCTTPFSGSLSFTDSTYGEITFDLSRLNDFVILKSDGMPTYHLAHVLDDHLMNITHVIRGEEWISSVPRHMLIQKGLGIAPPKYVHVPLLLGKDKSKLSKRHGASAIDDYMRMGYLPDALVNYMSLLGWSPNTEQEIFSRDELVEIFDLQGIQSHPAVFDMEKLTWLNGTYIRAMTTDKLADAVIPHLEKPHSEGGLPDSVARPIDKAKLQNTLPVVKERINRLDQTSMSLDFFFADIPKPSRSLLTAKGPTDADVLAGLQAARDVCAETDKFTHDVLEQAFRDTAKKLDLKPGRFFYPVRIAVTGRTIAPPLFDTMAILGAETCIKRISEAVKVLQAKF